MKSWKEYLLLIFFIFNLNGLYSQYPDSSNHFLSSIKFSNDSVCEKEILNSLYKLNTYEDAVSLAQQYVDSAVLTNDSTRLANMLLILGIMQENKGDNNNAFETLLNAYTIFKSIDNQLGAALTMDHLGTVFRYHGSKQKSLEYHTKAYEIFKKGNHSCGLINVLNSLGIINRQLGNDKEALEYHKQALSLALENKSTNISSIYISIGTYYWYKEVNDSALYYYKSALNIPPDNLLLKERHCAALNNIGNVYRSMLQYDSALYYYDLAIKESRLYQTRNLESINLKNLGRIYTLLGQYDKAYDLFQKSLQISTEINLKKVILENYLFLGKLFENQQDYKNALVYFKKYSELEHVILDEKQLAEINQIESYFSFEKRQALKIKEDSAKSLLIQKRRTSRTIYFALLFILLSTFLFILFQYRTKKKSNLLLIKLNEELELKVEERTKSLFNAKEKAEDNEIKFKAAFYTSPDSVNINKMDGEYVEINEGFTRLTGYTKDDVIGKLSSDVNIWGIPKDRETLIDTLHKFGIIENRESIFKSKDGRLIPALMSAKIITLKNEPHILSVTRAISERKKFEQELIAAKDKAEESDRLKSAFLANMSHEIRTPMNGILGFTNLLNTPDLTGEEQKNYIDIIQKSGNRMLNTVNDIIDISRIESGLVEFYFSEVNINEQLKYLYSFFQPEATNKGIQLIFKNNKSEQDHKCITDLEKFNSIVTNLIKNAIKYTDKGTIDFGYNIKKKNGAAELEFYIKDSGIGIPKDRQKAIFDRFVQADIEDVKANQGSGLGLAISKAYAEMLGGTIWVDSEEGKGSTFYFTIEYNSESKSKSITKNDREILKEDNISGKLKILIVEDDETSQDLTSILVEKFAEKIINVSSGLEAVEVCRNNTDIDMILMDIQLPDMNGYEATQQIRQFNKDVVIIAQTAYALTGDKEKAVNMGCNDYISKPISKSELYSLIKKYSKKPLSNNI